MPNGRRSFSRQASKVAGARATDDGVRLVRLLAVELAAPLKDERSRLVAYPAGEAGQPDEQRGAIASIHHQVLDTAVAFDVSSEGLGYGRLGHLRQIRAFAVRRFVPTLDREARIGSGVHGRDSWVDVGCRSLECEIARNAPVAIGLAAPYREVGPARAHRRTGSAGGRLRDPRVAPLHDGGLRDHR